MDATADAGDEAGRDAFVDAPPDHADTESGCIADLEHDPGNCGWCAHDCLGGTCSKGACQPFVFVTASGANLVRATDHNIAYSTVLELPSPTGSAQEVALYACPDDACPSGKALFFTTPADPMLDAGMLTFHSYAPLGLDLESARAYFVNRSADGSQGTLFSCAASGGTPTTLTGIGPHSATRGVVRTDGHSVYWSDGSSTISRCDIGGCAAPATFFAGAAGGDAGDEIVNDLAIDGTSLYWTTSTGVHKCATTPSGSTATCTAPTLLTGAPASTSGAFALTVDSANVYWVDAAGRIASCPISGCTTAPTILAMMQLDALELASDGDNLYWVAHDEGEVRTCATRGCGMMARTVAFGQTTPTSIAVNARAVYWATFDGIGKLAK
jgi:hypothetical protein